LGKSRGRKRAHKHEMNLKNATPLEGKATSPTQPEQQKSPLGGSLRSRLSFLDKTFRDWWFYVAAITLVVNLSYTFRPQLQVQSSSTPDSNPLETLFTLSNISPWPLRNVKLTCVLYNGENILGTFANNTIKPSLNAPAQGNPDIDDLPAGQPATRDCGFGNGGIARHGIDMRSVRLNTIISYEWFFWPRPLSLIQHFNTRMIGRHLILVPDVESTRVVRP